MRHLHAARDASTPTLPVHRQPRQRPATSGRVRLKHALLFAPLLLALPLLLHVWQTSARLRKETPPQPEVPSFQEQQQQPLHDYHETLHAVHDASQQGAADTAAGRLSPADSNHEEGAAVAARASDAGIPLHDKRCEGYDVHTDMDLLHGDLSTSPAATGVDSVGACCGLCAGHEGCVGLTLTPTGECWLKASAERPMKQRGLTSAMRIKAKPAANPEAQHQPAQLEEGTLPQAAAQAAQQQRRQPSQDGKAPITVEPGCSSDVAVGCMARPAIVVMSHDRPEMTRRCLKILLGLELIDKFTVYVSEDAGSHAVRSAALEFGGRVKEVLSSAPRPAANAFQRRGLSKISQHFRSALEATLVERGHSHVIMIEDDLLLSPDFLLLFWSGAWLLKADPTLWCISAWNDQGFPHTTHDPSRLMRTGYFPGLGWMISAELWRELGPKWPGAPTTGWDHWMRLTSTSRGRECVAPEINRSRHASSRGTNVLDNKPFERFSFERTGVTSFGDLSYLLHDANEKAVSETVRQARRLEWPGAWGGATAKDVAMRWVADLPASPPTLLLYTREQYKELAKPLGLWGENPRAFHNGTIMLHPPSGGTLLLADRRHSPYIDPSERLTPPSTMRQMKAAAGVSCDRACANAGLRCEAPQLEWGNTCEAMAKLFPCEAGCGHQVGPELPAYAASPTLDTHRQCLISDIAISTCAAAFAKTERLCTCI